MKRITKLFALFTALLMILALAACQSATQDTKDGSKPGEPSETAVLPDENENMQDGTIFETSCKAIWFKHFSDMEMLTRESVPAGIDPSLADVIPLLACIQMTRVSYDSLVSDDLQFFNESFPKTNQNDIENDAYVWYVMTNVFSVLGGYHKDTVSTVKTDEQFDREYTELFIPDSAARDILKVCFSQYTDDYSLLTEPPTVKNCATQMGREFYESALLVYDKERNGYVCEKLRGYGEVVISGGGEFDEGVFLHIYTADGPESEYVNDTMFWLKPLDEPILGLKWTIAKVIHNVGEIEAYRIIGR